MPKKIILLFILLFIPLTLFIYTDSLLFPLCLSKTNLRQSNNSILEEPTIKWKYTLDEPEVGCLALGDLAIGPDGTIYIATGASAGFGFAKLYAINPNGTKKWSFKLRNFWMTHPVVDKDGTIYVYSGPSLYAINPDGTKKWEKEDFPNMCYISLGTDGTIYGCDCTSGSYVRKIWAINKDGTTKWSVPINASPPCLMLGKNNEIYYMDVENYVVCLNSDNGSMSWKYKIVDSWQSGNTGFAILPDGTIIVNTGGHFTALNPNGTFKWKYSQPNGAMMPIIDNNGTVYITARDPEGRVVALNPDGTIKWKSESGKTGNGLGALSSDGTLYFPGITYIYALNTNNGNEKGKIVVSTNMTSPAIGSDGTVYTAGGLTLTAIKGGGSLLSSGWPRARHDNRNTSCAGTPIEEGEVKPDEKGKFEHYDTGDTLGADVRWFYWHAQTFTAESNHTVTSVKLKLYRIGTPGTLIVSIKNTDINGHPTGDDLIYGSIDGNTLTTDENGEWREIIFNKPLNLTSQVKYAIVARAPSGGGGNTVKWRTDGEPPGYPYGNREASGDSGVTWQTDLNSDYLFEVWGESPEIPKEKPTNLRAYPGDNKVYLEWDPPAVTTGIVGYNLYRSKTYGEYTSPATDFPVENTYHVDLNVENGIKYYYICKAVYEDGTESEPSNEVSVTPNKPKPVINLVDSTKTKEDKITFTGNVGPGATVTVNGMPVKVDENGFFTVTIPLNPGENTITIVIKTKAGDIETIIKKVIREVEKKKIVIKLQIGNSTAYINDVPKTLDVPPFIDRGRTLVPFRFIGEALGAKVGFTADPKTGRVITVTYELGKTFITLYIGQKYADVNGKRVELDVPPQIVKGRTVVPLRFVTEALGCDVKWDGTTKTITIIYILEE